MVISEAIHVSQTISVEEIIASTSMASDMTIGEVSKWSQTLFVEIIGGVRAILPLVIFLMIVLFVILRSKLPNNMITTYGLTLSIVGMCVFNIGLTYGLGSYRWASWNQSSCCLYGSPNK